ncbi:hypothetical protein [Psychrobacter sp. FDAARGOS_221]|uniref:hypothetical protein n=1 Tax=Psychrobacter sp. FDAARGOS_221 TaxID=1975705 RepID=UPI000BB54F60|nr:hypothetical protein [Psychrobacter sp. FDAARGOS_221]PNK61242.1 hypothetical protein A6J60_010395 [Psychrobacter sp. FDAARGOS_221]
MSFQLKQSPQFKQGLILSLTVLSLLAAQQASASSYQQVHDVVFNQALTPDISDDQLDAQIQQELAVYQAGKMPAYKVTSAQFTKKVRERLAIRSEQTLSDDVDYYERLEKLVHSNGICMAGTWQITEDVKNSDGQRYTGMFAKDAQSLFIGRLSVALSDTKQGDYQAFGMAGKIFGTTDADKEVRTENFFVADVLTGARRESVFEAPMTNKPKVGFRFSVLSLGLKIGPIFTKADEDAGMRPVTSIAKMGVAAESNAVSPKYMMLSPVQPVNYQPNPGIDFRQEFALSPQETAREATRDFTIYVSDTATKAEDNGWQRIGLIKADETKVSYGCDRQLHFAHPKV